MTPSSHRKFLKSAVARRLCHLNKLDAHVPGQMPLRTATWQVVTNRFRPHHAKIHSRRHLVLHLTVRHACPTRAVANKLKHRERQSRCLCRPMCRRHRPWQATASRQLALHRSSRRCSQTRQRFRHKFSKNRHLRLKSGCLLFPSKRCIRQSARQH